MTNLLNEILNIAVIREIESAFLLSVERCDRLLNLLCVTRRDDCSCASCHNLLLPHLSDAGRPAEHDNSPLGKLSVILSLLLLCRRVRLFCGPQPLATPQ
jgi:hypothetical protein